MATPARAEQVSTSGPRAVDRASALPLWAQVHTDLRRRLEAGEFTGVFPGELALVAEYAVSRHTVREALRRLRSEGIVTSERGRSPRVTGPAVIEQPLGALYSLFASVEAAGQIQRSVVRALDVRADGIVAARLELEESAPLLYLERLRLAGEAPLAVDRVWLPASLAAPLLKADFTHTALYDELARRCGVRLSGGREHLRAVVPTAAERALLGIGAGVAAFAIDRLACSGGRPTEWRHTLVRGDRFSVSAQFSARDGYRLDGAGLDARR
ncbi:MAG: GntR family transcriptional regulator [Pseudonocardiaceae bacterium]